MENSMKRRRNAGFFSDRRRCETRCIRIFHGVGSQTLGASRLSYQEVLLDKKLFRVSIFLFLQIPNAYPFISKQTRKNFRAVFHGELHTNPYSILSYDMGHIG